MNTIPILQRYGVYLLVLFAVALLIYILITLIQTFSLEQADRKAKEDRSEGVVNNIYYFINRTTLQQIQLSMGILLSGGVIATLVFCQVYEPVILLRRPHLPLCWEWRCRGSIFPPRCASARNSSKAAFWISRSD